ncbi:hypothetical protein WR25_27253 [Diploscapter pachys]|uniref:Gamma-glutamyltransferase n=1 Tax=Diploscapter pachys TaxID=2018661 RepID=A0A2A2L8B1_9BILA|nr:hypothetical protein WR25_27253 [Diploscapter pachys]
MPLPRIHSHDNLPPEEGPYDDEHEPLIHEPPEVHRPAVWAIFSVICIFILAILTVTFAALYAHLLSDRSHLPKWPKPSLSPMGQYSKASVAADNEYCSEIGRNTLLHGGNAVDAAIAALFCIGVMDSHSSGLGGGHFMVFYNASTQECHVVDAREAAPIDSHKEMFRDKWIEAQVGWRAPAVPGELHGLWTEFKNFGSGKITWDRLIQPTIELLEEGFPTSHALSIALKKEEKYIMQEETMKDFINPQTGKNYKSIIYKPSEVITTKLRNDFVICGPPPPSAGAVAQALISIMDSYDYNRKSIDDVEQFYHHFLEASKFAYAFRSWLGDPKFIHNATEIARNITRQEWADMIRSKITEETHPDEYYGGKFVNNDHGTTHISVVDALGNAVAVTSTIDLYMGARVASPSTGIVWNDELDDFSLPGRPNFFNFPPSPANFIEGGKRPMSSMSPLIIRNTKTGKLYVFGGAGGSMIISSVAGAALQSLKLGATIKQAIDSPRLHNQLEPNCTQYEKSFPVEYVSRLQARGHMFCETPSIAVVTGIVKEKEGKIYANSDFRKGEESSPAGY